MTDSTPEAIGRQVDLLAEARRLLRDVRADARRVLARLAAAENVAALAADHLESCWGGGDLAEAVAEWHHATRFAPPAAADEVDESSYELGHGR